MTSQYETYEEIGWSRERAQKLIDQIRPGDTVYIVNRVGFGQHSCGRAVMPNSVGWVLNMGGPHGTPKVVTADNITAVPYRWRNKRFVRSELS